MPHSLQLKLDIEYSEIREALPSLKSSYPLYTIPILINTRHSALINSWCLAFGKFLLKAKDPSLTLRMTALFGGREGERRGDRREII